MSILFALTLLLQTPAAPAIPVLRPGDEVESEIVETDPVAHTRTLDTRYVEAPVHAKTFRVEHDGSGPVHIDLRSHCFDAYLVVRGPDGQVLFEDDDGLLRTHSRVVLDADAPRALEIHAAALHGGAGPFRLVVAAGRAVPLDPRERSAAELADARAAVEATESALGPEHVRVGASVNELAILLYEQGALGEARPLFERVLRITESVFGEGHPETADSASNLGRLLRDQGAYGEARPLLERALSICESTRGPNDATTADFLDDLAMLLKAQGATDEARPLYERALRIREAVFGEDHRLTANSLVDLAHLLSDQNAYDEARPLYERALRIYESVRGEDDPNVANILKGLGLAMSAQGAYDEAQPIFERALRIRESVLGANHPATATILNCLAHVLREQGAYAEARPLYERALRIRETVLGEAHPSTATSLNNLGVLLFELGALDEARSLHERALRIRESALGEDHPSTASSLSNLALLLKEQGAYDEARPLLERALRIDEAVSGEDHPSTAIGLNNMGGLLMAQGAYAEARPLLERALRIKESALGGDHPDTAAGMSSLAFLLHNQGALDEARPLYERALRVAETALGPNHQYTSTFLSNLAFLEADMGEAASAFSRTRAALASSTRRFEDAATTLTEVERLRFLGTLASRGEAVLSLARARGGAEAGRVAYASVLEGKGRVGRGLLREGLRAVSARPEEEQVLIRELQAVQRRLSDAVYAEDVGDSEAHAQELERLRGERNRLEVELARRRGESEGDGEDVEGARLAELHGALSEGSVAVDFLMHRWFEPAEWEEDRIVRKRRWSKPHVSAWVIRPSQPLAHFDLGEASALEVAGQEFLERMRGRRAAPVTIAEDAPKGDRLRELLWDPLREAVGDARVVHLSGDGFLGGVPFETLRDDDGTYLIEHHAFSYHGDLAGLPRALTAVEAEAPRLFAVGGVEYWERGAAVEGLDGDSRAPVSRTFTDLRWTDAEVSAVSGMHRRVAGKDARQIVLRGADATEERIKTGLAGFTHVHLATHGFFHPEGVPSAWKMLREQDDGGQTSMRESERRVVGVLPGLLSGLVFAGANAEPEPGRDNGLLTAEEITYLDLTSADLVVLSACETGLGRPEAGEGMIGLRRAFRMAGARTVISSLWEVDDQATRDLMTLFYENLWRRGMPKLEALRQAQLSILEENRKRYGDGRPATWGAFVLDGSPN